MKKYLVLLLLVFAVSFANADPVTLTYVGDVVGPTHYSPYIIKVTPPGEPGVNMILVCGSEINNIDPPKSWPAWTYDIGNVTSNTTFVIPDLSPADKAQERWNVAGILAQMMLVNPTDPNNVTLQKEVWWVLGLSASDPGAAVKTAVQDMLDADLALNWRSTFYIPVAPFPNGMKAQPFIGAPEPSSLILLGFGLIGFARKLRGKFMS